MLFSTHRPVALTYLDAGAIGEDPTEHKQPEARPKAASALLKLVGLSCSIRSECAPGVSRYSDKEPIRFPVVLVASIETCSMLLPENRATLLRGKHCWSAGNILLECSIFRQVICSYQNRLNLPADLLFAPIPVTESLYLAKSNIQQNIGIDFDEITN